MNHPFYHSLLVLLVAACIPLRIEAEEKPQPSILQVTASVSVQEDGISQEPQVEEAAHSNSALRRSTIPTRSCYPDCLWPAHIGVEGRGGNFQEGAGVDLWAPIGQDGRAVVFIQGGGGYFQSLTTSSIGLGGRALFSPRLAFGANVFGDLGIAQHGATFGQIGVGLELFGCGWLLRTNGYFPVVKAHTRSSQQAAIAEETTVLTGLGLRAESYPGFDIEAGGELRFGLGHLWAYGGYFYRDRESQPSISGPRVRVEYRLDCGRPFPRFEWIVNAQYEHDHIHGHTVSGYGGIRYYLGRCRPPTCCDSPLCRYMGRRVWRDRAIWVEMRNLPGIPNQIIFVDNSTDGIGIQTDPATLANGLAMLNPEGVLFFLQNTGNITAGATMAPEPNTQLLGFGDQPSRPVLFANGETFLVTDLTGAGRAVVEGGALLPVVSAPSGAFISGWQIEDGFVGIAQESGVGPVSISDMILIDTTFNAIDSTSGGALTIRDTISTGSDRPLNCSGTAGRVVVNNCRFTGNRGIFWSSPGVGGELRVINGSEITGMTSNAIFFDRGRVLRIEDSTITGSALDGILVLGSATAPGTDIRIFNSTITSATTGIVLNRASALGTSHVLVIEGSRVTGGAFQDGIRWNTFLSSPTITFNERIRNNPLISGGDLGLDVTPPLTAVVATEVSNNTFTGLRAARFRVSNTFGTGTTNITCDGNSLTGAAGSPGYDFRGGGPSVNLVCATIQNNLRTPIGANDINFFFYEGADSKSVFDFSGGTAGLSANNNGIGVFTFGAGPAAAPTSCPLPVIPPAP